MASKRKQINVRVDESQEEMIPRLCEAIAAQQGLSVGVSDLFRMGLVRLAREFLPADGPAKTPRKKASPGPDSKPGGRHVRDPDPSDPA